MKHIKRCLFFLGALFGIALIGFFGLIGVIGVYGVFATVWEYCPSILIGLALFGIGVAFAAIGWSIFYKCSDKLKDS